VLISGEWVDTEIGFDVGARMLTVDLPLAAPFALVEPADTDTSIRVSVLDSLSNLAPAYGKRGTVTVRVIDAEGAPVIRRWLTLRTASGGQAAAFREVAGSPGTYRATPPLVRSRTAYRVDFDGDALNTAASRVTAIKPKVSLTRKAPSSVSAGRRFTVSGRIRPAHSRASIKVEVQRRSAAGTYRASGQTKTVRTSTTLVKTTLSLPTGSWRVRFVHADEGHARTATAWAYVRVR
jgi:hypothetical protein